MMNSRLRKAIAVATAFGVSAITVLATRAFASQKDWSGFFIDIAIFTCGALIILAIFHFGKLFD